MQSYVTATEMAALWPGYSNTNYSSTEKSQALETSFGLVNSYISPTVKIPALLEFDPESETVNAPQILKWAQSQFVQFLLKQGEFGITDEIQEQFDKVVEILRGIQDGELEVSSQINELQQGWSITSSTLTEGKVHIRYPTSSFGNDYPVTYIFNMDQENDDVYPYNADNNSTAGEYATFEWKEYGASGWSETDVKAENRWVSVGNHGLSILFEGKFNTDETFTIKGIPAESVNTASNADTIRTAKLYYK